MIWIFLFPLLFAIFAWRWFGNIIPMVLYALIGFLISVLVAILIGLAVPTHWTKTETAQLISLRDSNSISGHFFLGTGSINATEHYFFFYKEGWRYKARCVPVANSVIFEENRQNGEFKVYNYQFVNPSFSLIALPLPKVKYEFAIPEGSSKNNFVLQ